MRDNFAEKHPDAVISERIRDKILTSAEEGRLTCAAAFGIAEKLNISASEVGKTLDLMNFRLNKCQLGLFGYSPDRKIVTAEEPSSELRQTIAAAAHDGRLSCKEVWEIAERMNLPKMSVGNACESMKIRIKPCQLGAF
jgi:hypothetical protein